MKETSYAMAMEEIRHPEPANRTLEIHLTTGDFQILEKYRGELTPDAFIASLLRMIDGGTVSGTPGWVKKNKED